MLKKAAKEEGALLPLFVAPSQLKPFITKELEDGPLKPKAPGSVLWRKRHYIGFRPMMRHGRHGRREATISPWVSKATDVQPSVASGELFAH